MDSTHTTLFKLTVESDIGFDDEYFIARDRKVIIGRGGDSNIQLPKDLLASREHCEIFFKDSHFVIHDLGSSNGTQLNNQNIGTFKIKNNDVICVGTTIFRANIDTIEREVDVKTTAPSQQSYNSDSNYLNKDNDDFKNETKVELKEPFSLFVDDEEEPLPFIENISGFKVQAMMWQDQDGSNKLSVIVKSTFTMFPDKEAELSDKSIPLFKQTYFYDDKDHGSILYESDLVPFKPLTDIVIVGKAHTPNKQSQQILDVGLQVGKTKKIIKVFGDRYWNQAEEEGEFAISEPALFTTMDVKYEKSFGGSDLDNGTYCQQNPIGCGCISEESLGNSKFRKLPNIENPQDLLESWASRPDPVGFGFYANNWESRFQYLGSYEKETLEKDQIGLPKNFNNRFYNSAHPDLQVEGYLVGDEKVELVNLSSKGRLIFNLPNVKPEVVVRKKTLNIKDTKDEKCDESHIKMQLDTLVFIPEEDVFYQVFRGVYNLDSMESIQSISVMVS